MAVHKISTALALLELADQETERDYTNNITIIASQIIWGSRYQAKCLVH